MIILFSNPSLYMYILSQTLVFKEKLMSPLSRILIIYKRWIIHHRDKQVLGANNKQFQMCAKYKHQIRKGTLWLSGPSSCICLKQRSLFFFKKGQGDHWLKTWLLWSSVCHWKCKTAWGHKIVFLQKMIQVQDIQKPILDHNNASKVLWWLFFFF